MAWEFLVGSCSVGLFGLCLLYRFVSVVVWGKGFLVVGDGVEGGRVVLSGAEYTASLEMGGGSLDTHWSVGEGRTQRVVWERGEGI